MTARHYEQQYLDLVRRVWTVGDIRIDRTGIGTKSLFGEQLRFDLSGNAMPLLTTKRVFWKTAAREMLWFISGETNIRPLIEQGVHIWTDWPLARYNAATGGTTTREQFEDRLCSDPDFAATWGDLGPVYGKQWVDWPTYLPVDGEEGGNGTFRAGPGVNQIAALVDSLRTNPASRRHIVTGWNVAELDRMALPPCHMTYQYHVSDGKLSGMLWQRSCDLGLGFAFNVFSAALLVRMLAQQCDLEPGDLVWSGGDCHLYLNHEALVTEQLARTPAGAPKLRLTRRPPTIFDYTIDDFDVYDYVPQPHIAAPVAV